MIMINIVIKKVTDVLENPQRENEFSYSCNKIDYNENICCNKNVVPVNYNKTTRFLKSENPDLKLFDQPDALQMNTEKYNVSKISNLQNLMITYYQNIKLANDQLSDFEKY